MDFQKLYVKTPKSPNEMIRYVKLNIPVNISATLTKNGYVINKSKLDINVLASLKKSLTVKPIMPDEIEEKIKSFPVFTEEKNTITVPRFYGIHKFGQPSRRIFSDTKTNALFTGKLRDNQIPIVNTVTMKMKKDGGGLLIAGCGVGKTTMGLYIGIHELKEKVLVLTHKTFLQDQWLKRAREFTNAKVGIIRQNTIADKDCDIVIGMIQSICKRDYDPAIFDRFGMVIIDEAHHFASPIFSQALFKCGAKYILGLTATPKRQDGLTKILHWHIGNILYKQKKKPNKQVVAKIFKYTSTSPQFIEKKRWTPMGVKPNTVEMISNLIDIESRNTHIVNIINELRKNPEKKILILSGRIEHLKTLKNAVDGYIKMDEDAGILEKDEIITSFYIGGMKPHKRQYAEEFADILFGTYDMAQEGLDIDRLNTIILSTPKRNIIQAIGRIMRRILKTGDVRPLIIDIVDQLSVFCDDGQGRARSNEYKENKYKIETYHLNNNKILTYSEVLKMNYNEQEIKDIIKEAKVTDVYENNFKYILDTDKAQVDDIPECVNDNGIDSESDYEDMFETIKEERKYKHKDPTKEKRDFKYKTTYVKPNFSEYAF